MKRDRLVVDLFDTVGRQEVQRRRGGRARALIGQSTKGRDDVVSLKVAAIMELDALAQLERPGLGVGRRSPRSRELRLRHTIRADPREEVQTGEDGDDAAVRSKLVRVDLDSR